MIQLTAINLEHFSRYATEFARLDKEVLFANKISDSEKVIELNQNLFDQYKKEEDFYLYSLFMRENPEFIQYFLYEQMPNEIGSNKNFIRKVYQIGYTISQKYPKKTHFIGDLYPLFLVYTSDVIKQDYNLCAQAIKQDYSGKLFSYMIGDKTFNKAISSNDILLADSLMKLYQNGEELDYFIVNLQEDRIENAKRNIKYIGNVELVKKLSQKIHQK